MLSFSLLVLIDAVVAVVAVAAVVVAVVAVAVVVAVVACVVNWQFIVCCGAQKQLVIPMTK